MNSQGISAPEITTLTGDHVDYLSNRVIMMTSKKRLINLLFLPIAINMVSINPSYALTSAQYKTLIYGLAAGGAWAGWGTLNAVLAYIERGGGELTTTDGANIFAAICGANAAVVFRSWRPPTDPISAANIMLAAVKAGAVTATASTCRWVSNAVLKTVFSNDQAQVASMNAQEKSVVYHDANVLISLKAKLENQIDVAARKDKAADDSAATYRHECSYGIVSVYCNEMAEQAYLTSNAAKVANIAVRQTAWDIANTALKIAHEEHDFISSQNKMSPRPK
ncbi:hypothetical protein [Dickeya dadantii]|uniref:hypothetical protein n=1 Tax=Dickeya dadantii TaxID=204038 RepID=UPI001CC640A4|nr:hypothetical protein [Dickeya dadantii]UAY94765.1 hypothetical protein KTF62_12950 [Dickeya dadantii]